MSEDQESAQKAKSLALQRLTRREHSEAELKDILTRKGFELEIIEPLLSELVEKKFLSDERFKKAFVSDQVLKGKGPRAIQLKLRQKGVRAELDEIQEISEERAGTTDQERALEIVERRYPGFREDRSEAQRAYQALLRRGFSFDLAREVVFSKAVFKDTDISE